MDKTELRERLEFRKAALKELRKAYIELSSSGGVKSYTVGDRQLSRHDLGALKKEISELEREVDELEAALNGNGPKRLFGVVYRDW